MPWGSHIQGWLLAQGRTFSWGSCLGPPDLQLLLPCRAVPAHRCCQTQVQDSTLALGHSQRGLRSVSPPWTGQVIQTVHWSWWPSSAFPVSSETSVALSKPLFSFDCSRNIPEIWILQHLSCTPTKEKKEAVLCLLNLSVNSCTDIPFLFKFIC